MLTQLTPKALSRLMLLACLAAPASGSEKMSEPMKQFVEKEARYLLTPDEKKAVPRARGRGGATDFRGCILASA